MLLEQTKQWTTVEAYLPRRPSRWRLLMARAEWLWLSWRAGAEMRREARTLALMREADLPAYLKRDIGLM